jgi:hypothetical protein
VQGDEERVHLCLAMGHGPLVIGDWPLVIGHW